MLSLVHIRKELRWWGFRAVHMSALLQGDAGSQELNSREHGRPGGSGRWPASEAAACVPTLRWNSSNDSTPPVMPMS